MRLAALVLTLLAAPSSAAPPAGAQAPPGSLPQAPKPPAPLTTVEGISEYALDNGLRVLLFPDASKPTVTVNVTYFVGSRHEGYGESGMAHLLEHLVFKGTPKHDNIWKLLQDHGAIFNGSTWFDRTNYYETLPAGDENLSFALELEADRMVNSRISGEDLAKEFSVVRNELERGENNPQRVLEQRMYASAYLWHNYGKATIGSKSDIERVPVESLRQFYQRYYQPDNAMLVVAGKLEVAPALALIQKTFGAIARPKRALAATHTVEPVQDGERAVVLKRTGDVGVVGLMYHALAGAAEDFVAEEAIADLLTDKPSGRLYQALVQKGLAARVEGQAGAFAEPGTLELFAEVNAGKPLEPVRDQMLALAESLARTPITDEEVTRFKTRELKEFELAMTDSRRIGVQLSEWAAIGDWRMLFIHRDRVKKLTADDVRRIAAAYVQPSNRTVGMFVPTKAPARAPLPEPVDVLATVAGYRGEANMAEGEVFAATVENIEQRTARGGLASGMKLALLAKRTRGHAVKLAVRLHVGGEQDVKGKIAAVQMLSAMLLRGTTRHTYQQLRDQLDQLKADVRAESGELPSAGFGVTTTREHLPAVLALIAEMLEHPSFPADQFDTLKREQLARLEEALQDPQALASNLIKRKSDPHPKDDVRYTPTVAE